jgi:hypothetical protein
MHGIEEFHAVCLQHNGEKTDECGTNLLFPRGLIP